LLKNSLEVAVFKIIILAKLADFIINLDKTRSNIYAI